MNPIEYLNYRENINPQKVAIYYRGESITFKTLMNVVRNGALFLREAGIDDDAILALNISDPLDQWVATLSCFSENMTSFYGDISVTLPIKFSKRVALTDKKESEKSDHKSLVWPTFNELQKQQQKPFTQKNTDFAKLARIFFTSGTTGKSKAISYSFKELTERSLARVGFMETYASAISMMPPHSSSGLHFCLKQWMMGLAVSVDSNVTDIANAIAMYKIRQLIGSPNQIRALLQEWQLLKIKPDIESLTVLGGKLTSKLYKEIRSQTDANIYTQYGASETGPCAIKLVESEKDVGKFGTPCPGVKVELVSHEGHPVRKGMEGFLKIQTPYMANEYLTGEVRHNRGFHNGWFYPGDIARRNTTNNDIELVGRMDEVVNLGGSKVNLTVIDDFFLNQEGISDAASFLLEDNLDYPEIWVAVVVPQDYDLFLLMNLAINKLGHIGAFKRIIPVAVIPRTYSGKPQRSLMSQKVKELLNAK